MPQMGLKPITTSFPGQYSSSIAMQFQKASYFTGYTWEYMIKNLFWASMQEEQALLWLWYF